MAQQLDPRITVGTHPASVTEATGTCKSVGRKHSTRSAPEATWKRLIEALEGGILRYVRSSKVKMRESLRNG